MIQAESAVIYEGDGVMLTEDRFVVEMAKSQNGGLSRTQA